MGWLVDWRIAPAGFLLLSFGLIIMAIVAPLKISDQINKTLEEEFLFTKEGQPGWNRFVNNTQSDSAASYLKLWIVNTTNVDVAQMGGRPMFNEVGPYVFRQYIVNADYQFSYLMNNYTFTPYSDGLSERVITFVPWIYMIYDETHPDNANHSLDDVFTVPNYGLFALWNNPSLASNPLKYVLLSFIVNGTQLSPTIIIQPQQPFQTRTARELLFGYVDPLLDSLKQVGLPVPTNTFQFIRNQTNTTDARNQVNTTTLSCGFPNTVRFQQFIMWQNKSSINYWDPPVAPTGTPGNYYGFDERGESQPLQMFWAQLGRHLGLHSTGESSVKGVDTFTYKFDDREVYNSTQDPANAQWYQNGLSGIFNATTVNGAPIFYSWPHFYKGDPALRDWYDGLPDPTQSEDESYFEIQQVIGVATKGRRYIQGNLLVGGLGSDIGGWNYSMPDIKVWPEYIMKLETELTDAQADQMRDALDFYDRALAGQTALLAGGAIGAFLSFCVSIFLFYKRRDQWNKGSTIGLLQEDQQTEDVPIGYVESPETQGTSSYGARS